ncbi:hypothetical protein [Methylomonas sp. MK1]|uniref:hypothetical protein n=1 Tax=Methylomonas sp. MK1 TaxID=1131552 RepID=UPI0003765C1E|nr:hypothetical protein [Methylomonas sp. MK1]
MSNRYLHSLWCDDIRLEVGNKPSFMGSYLGGVTIPFTPFIFPKLCCYIWASTPIDNPFKKVEVQVTRDDGTLLTQMVLDNPEEMIATIEATEDAKSLFLMFGLTIAPAEIPEGCKYLVVTMKTEAETLEGPKLRITIAPPAL